MQVIGSGRGARRVSDAFEYGGVAAPTVSDDVSDDDLMTSGASSSLWADGPS